MLNSNPRPPYRSNVERSHSLYHRGSFINDIAIYNVTHLQLIKDVCIRMKVRQSLIDLKLNFMQINESELQ